MKPETVMRSTDDIFNPESAVETDRKRKQRSKKNPVEAMRDHVCEVLDRMSGGSIHPHSKLFNFHRARLIMKRIRTASMFLAVLVVLWAAIDLYAFPLSLAAPLAGCLVLAGVLLVTLVFACQRTPSVGRARLAVGLLLTVVAAVFVFSDQILLRANLSIGNHAAESAYTLLPFFCLAGLAVVPLSLAELSLFAVPFLSIFLASFLMPSNSVIWGHSPIVLTSILSFVVVITGISSLSQLNLMQGMLRQSLRDPVTRTLNRRSGELILELELAQAKRSGFPLTVVFLDLNDFKQVNDQLGHVAGDEVLRCVANFLRTGLRASDALVRWGGDEFLLIMPRATEVDVTKRLTALMDRQWSPTFYGWNVTWSMGIAQWPNDSDADTGKALLTMADSRMYSTKQRRNDDCTRAA